MTEQEAFEAWWKSRFYDENADWDSNSIAKDAWKACDERKNEFINGLKLLLSTLQDENNKQVDELKALRKFAKHALSWDEPLDLENTAQELGLWDRNRRPTKLLTGETTK